MKLSLFITLVKMIIFTCGLIVPIKNVCFFLVFFAARQEKQLTKFISFKKEE